MDKNEPIEHKNLKKIRGIIQANLQNITLNKLTLRNYIALLHTLGYNQIHNIRWRPWG